MSIIIDIETTGLPIRGLEADEYNIDSFDTSRIVQISFMICDDTLCTIDQQTFIVKPNDFYIRKSEYHKITNEIGIKNGYNIDIILKILSNYLKHVSHIIAHNIEFDIQIIRSECYRYKLHDILNEIDIKYKKCTMEKTKNIVKSKNRGNRIKKPNLGELYSYATGQPILEQHDAKYDVINLHKAIKILYDSRKISFDEPFVYLTFVKPVSVQKIEVQDIIDKDSDKINKPLIKTTHKVFNIPKLEMINIKMI
jgi:DNA polymerase-3 subunit alpha